MNFFTFAWIYVSEVGLGYTFFIGFFYYTGRCLCRQTITYSAPTYPTFLQPALLQHALSAFILFALDFFCHTNVTCSGKSQRSHGLMNCCICLCLREHLMECVIIIMIMFNAMNSHMGTSSTPLFLK